MLDEFAAIARDKSREGVEYAKTGDAGAAMQGAAKVMRAEFRTRYVYHAQMEPMNATASVAADGKSAELWVGTQGPTRPRRRGRRPPPDRARQRHSAPAMGRRRLRPPLAERGRQDAVRLSKAVGKPVKLIWSREDDMRGGKFRPATAAVHRGGPRRQRQDRSPGTIAWSPRSVSTYMAAARGGTPPKTDQIVMKGTPVPMYGIPNKLAEHVVRAARRAACRIARRRQRAQRLRHRELPRRDRAGHRQGPAVDPA